MSIYIYTSICAWTYTHTRTLSHTHSHTHTHIYIYVYIVLSDDITEQTFNYISISCHTFHSFVLQIILIFKLVQIFFRAGFSSKAGLGKRLWSEGRITRLWVFKGRHLLKSKNLVSIQVQVFIFHLFRGSCGVYRTVQRVAFCPLGTVFPYLF